MYVLLFCLLYRKFLKRKGLFTGEKSGEIETFIVCPASKEKLSEVGQMLTAAERGPLARSQGALRRTTDINLR